MHKLLETIVEKTKNTYHQTKRKAALALIPLSIGMTSCNTNGFKTEAYQVTNSSGEYVDARLTVKDYGFFGTTEKIQVWNGQDKILLYNTQPRDGNIEKMRINGELYKENQKGMANAMEKGTADFNTMKRQLLEHRSADGYSTLQKGKSRR